MVPLLPVAVGHLTGDPPLARTRPLATYPSAHFLALIERAPITVPATKTQAASLRGEIYAWRRACEQSPGEASLLGVNPAVLRDIILRIGEHGLEVLPMNELPSIKLIESALGTAPARVDPAAEALARMQSALRTEPTPTEGE